MRKAQLFEMLALQRLQNRSGSTYAADRASEVADLAEGLSRRPAQVAAKLKRFGIEQPVTDFFFWVIEQIPQEA